MENNIHPTAIVSDEVILGKGNNIGPYCVLEGKISIGDNNTFKPHSYLTGIVEIGDDNNFFSFCSIGENPQDLTFKDEDTVVKIGDKNTFREYVSIHRGTIKQDKETVIGSNNYLMAKVHVGHDTIIGDDCILVNSCNLAGHVTIGNRVIISGNSGVAQFLFVGDGAFVGAATSVTKDIPPYCTALGNRAMLKGINIIGLRRQGVEKEHISELVNFIRLMEASHLSPRSFVEVAENVEEYEDNKIVMDVVESIKKSKAGIVPFFHDR